MTAHRIVALAVILTGCIGQPEHRVTTEFPLATDQWDAAGNVTGVRKLGGVVTRVELEGDRLFPCEPVHIESVGTTTGLAEDVTARLTAKRCDIGADPVTLVLWVRRDAL